MARPAQYDRDKILDKAMQTFWEHGYHATSISDLVEATRLQPGSLYAAFESKRGLFLAALDHYAGQSHYIISIIICSIMENYRILA